MKLTKLQSLAEGTSKDDGQTKVFKIMDPLTDLIESADENVTKIMEKLHSDVLTDLLKQEGFPATESKAAKDAAKAAVAAVRKLHEELMDLHMSLGMHFHDEDLNEAKAPTSNPENEERIIRNVLKQAEQHLSRSARYKSWDTDHYNKTIDWITQESSPEESKQAAKTLVSLIRKAGVKGTGWTVRVVIRDEYKGDKTKWHAKFKV